MPIKAILFDIDGTLVDSNDLHVTAWEAAFAGRDLQADRASIRGQIGKGGDKLVPALFPDLSEDEVEALSDAHGEVFKARYLDQVRPFPHARDVVARVHAAGLKVALASSASEGELEHYLKLLDLDSLVDATTTIDDVNNSKPAGDIVATALKKLGVEPGEALLVGDTPYDIESAGKCGVGTVAVLSGGFSREALKRAKAIYDDVAALAAAWPEWVDPSEPLPPSPRT